MEVFYSVGIIQVIFSLFLIGKKQELILADKILMLLLAFWGIELGYSLLNFVYIPELPDFIMFPYTFGPLLFLYTYLLTSENRTLPHNYWLHFIPFVVFSLIALLLSKYLDYFEASFSRAKNTGLLYIINFVVFIIQSLFYWRIIHKTINLHNYNLMQKLSINTDNINLNWIRIISIFVFGGFAVFVLLDTLFFIWGRVIFEPSIFLHFGILMAIYSVSFFGFKQEAIFESQQYSRFIKKQEEEPSLSDPKNSNELERLLNYLEKDKPYLIRNLSLQDMANAIHIPTYKLSDIINNQLNKNFFTLINERRVEEAKRRITSHEHNHLTLSAIGHDSGFNSKSSFHELFKRYTGLTPSQYRKQKG